MNACILSDSYILKDCILYFLTGQIVYPLNFPPMASVNFVAYTKFADLEKYGDEYLINKAPFQIPDSVREFLVRFGPYAMIVFMILGLLAYLSLYSSYATVSEYAMMYGGYGMMG